MGSSVKAANMPEQLRRLLISTFAKLPYRVLWKYESTLLQNDLPPNVKIARWLPQQGEYCTNEIAFEWSYEFLTSFLHYSHIRYSGSQKVESIHHTRWTVEHVRDGLSWSASSCHAGFLWSRCELWEINDRWLWWAWRWTRYDESIDIFDFISQLTSSIWKRWHRKNSSKLFMRWFTIQNTDVKQSEGILSWLKNVFDFNWDDWCVI